MRIYKILFFSAMLFLAACASEESVPDNILQPEQITPLLVDVHLMDGVLYSYNQAQDTLYKKSMGKYVEIFKKHHTDTAAFKKSYTWYTQHPVILDKIYDDVLVKLQQQSESLNKSESKKNVVPAK